MESNKLYTIGNFAIRIGMSKATLRRWDEKDILKPAMILPSGQRRYTEEQAIEYEKACRERVNNK